MTRESTDPFRLKTPGGAGAVLSGIFGTAGKDSPQPFVKAQRSGGDRIYYRADGKTVIRHRTHTKAATRSWLNNNPGNIQYGAFARAQGAIGTDGRYAIFPDAGTGSRAQENLLREHYSHLTLAQAIAKYSPPSENDTGAYIAYVEKNAGIDRDTKIGDLNREQMHSLMRTMSHVEGWKEGEIIAGGQRETVPQPAAAVRAESDSGSRPVTVSMAVKSNNSVFDEAVSRVIGTDDRVRTVNGTTVKYGISQGANPDIDVAHLSRAQAVALYKDRYWNKIQGIETLSRDSALAAFDAAYCHGSVYASHLVNEAGGDAPVMASRRATELPGDRTRMARMGLADTGMLARAVDLTTHFTRKDGPRAPVAALAARGMTLAMPALA